MLNRRTEKEKIIVERVDSSEKRTFYCFCSICFMGFQRVVLRFFFFVKRNDYSSDITERRVDDT